MSTWLILVGCILILFFYDKYKNVKKLNSLNSTVSNMSNYERYKISKQMKYKMFVYINDEAWCKTKKDFFGKEIIDRNHYIDDYKGTGKTKAEIEKNFKENSYSNAFGLEKVQNGWLFSGFLPIWVCDNVFERPEIDMYHEARGLLKFIKVEDFFVSNGAYKDLVFQFYKSKKAFVNYKMRLTVYEHSIFLIDPYEENHFCLPGDVDEQLDIGFRVEEVERLMYNQHKKAEYLLEQYYRKYKNNPPEKGAEWEALQKQIQEIDCGPLDCTEGILEKWEYSHEYQSDDWGRGALHTFKNDCCKILIIDEQSYNSFYELDEVA